jgi:hypothetical protein
MGDTWNDFRTRMVRRQAVWARPERIIEWRAGEVTMKKGFITAVLASLYLALVCTTAARAQAPGYIYPIPRGGYVYSAPRGWAVPPVPYYYGYGAAYGYSPGYWRALPPYGFGSPYYNGHNDPYAPTYGSGVRDFLWMGGANFYGW